MEQAIEKLLFQLYDLRMKEYKYNRNRDMPGSHAYTIRNTSNDIGIKFLLDSKGMAAQSCINNLVSYRKKYHNHEFQ